MLSVGFVCNLCCRCYTYRRRYVLLISRPIEIGLRRCMVGRIWWNGNIMEKSRMLLKLFKTRHCELPEKFKCCDT
jgi:hypothetical protein